jgi:hypothetical protein
MTCFACGGRGFILAFPHPDHLEIQRCDACDRYPDDNAATQACYDARSQSRTVFAVLAYTHSQPIPTSHILHYWTHRHKAEEWIRNIGRQEGWTRSLKLLNIRNLSVITIHPRTGDTT